MSSAQERAAFIVIVDHSAGHEPVIGDVLWALLNSRTFNEASNPDWKVHVTDLTPEMLAHHKLVDDDTARLVALGRAVEAMERRAHANTLDALPSDYVAIGWNTCLHAIYREAGGGAVTRIGPHRPPDSPTPPETPSEGTPVPPEPSEGDTAPVSGTVPDLMAALERSVAQAKAARRSGGAG